jgi:hypothetical protein
VSACVAESVQTFRVFQHSLAVALSYIQPVGCVHSMLPMRISVMPINIPSGLRITNEAASKAMPVRLISVCLNLGCCEVIDPRG